MISLFVMVFILSALRRWGLFFSMVLLYYDIILKSIEIPKKVN